MIGANELGIQMRMIGSAALVVVVARPCRRVGPGETNCTAELAQ